MAKKTKEDKVEEWLIENDRNLSWLSKKSGVSYPHLYFILRKRERPLTETVRNKINEALQTRF